MCTISLYRDVNQYVFTMSRDERRDRGEYPPQCRMINQVSCVYPIDKQAGGTWFGRNHFGVTIALLNKYHVPLIKSATSRGGLIPEALAEGDYASVVAHLASRPMHQFNAFDMVVAGPSQTMQVSWNTSKLSKTVVKASPWYFFTSSSVEFSAVDRYRRAHFSRWAEGGDWCDVIDQVHLWQTTNKSYSILMDRPASHTKSISQVVFPHQTDMTYIPI